MASASVISSSKKRHRSPLSGADSAAAGGAAAVLEDVLEDEDELASVVVGDNPVVLAKFMDAFSSLDKLPRGSKEFNDVVDFVSSKLLDYDTRYDRADAEHTIESLNALAKKRRMDLDTAYAMTREMAMEKLASDLAEEIEFHARQEADKPYYYYTEEMVGYSHQNYLQSSVGSSVRTFFEMLCIKSTDIASNKAVTSKGKEVFQKRRSIPSEERGSLAWAVAHMAASLYDHICGSRVQWIHSWNVFTTMRTVVKSDFCNRVLCKALIGGPGSLSTISRLDDHLIEADKKRAVKSVFARDDCDVICMLDNGSPDYNPTTSQQGEQRISVVTIEDIGRINNPSTGDVFLQRVAENGPRGFKKKDTLQCSEGIFDLTEEQSVALNNDLLSIIGEFSCYEIISLCMRVYGCLSVCVCNKYVRTHARG